MSLVGTRPILQDELEQYELHHRARIAIKPGITGMWQVSGRSDITDFEEVVRLDTEYISKLIREARFSIYPSEWYENCPFSVMESQMYGTPVLGAEIGGIPELIQVGKTGELFESGNAEDLKKKIEKLWGDKKLCEQYSKNCKDISFDTIDEYYEKIMKVYR